MAELQKAPHVKCVEVFQPITNRKRVTRWLTRTRVDNRTKATRTGRQGNPDQQTQKPGQGGQQGGQQGNPGQQTQKPGQGGQQGGQDNPGQQNQK